MVRRNRCSSRVDPTDDGPAMDGDVADQGWGDALDRLGSDVASTEWEGCDAIALLPEEHLLVSVRVPDQDEGARWRMF